MATQYGKNRYSKKYCIDFLNQKKEKILAVQREAVDIERELAQAYKRWEELESK